MRYTRYEYKKSGKIKFLFSILIIAIITIACGLYVSNFIFNGQSIQRSNMNKTENSAEVQKFMALQCGYYSKEENAKELLTSLSKYCTPFIIEEDGKYRVIAGIYKEDEGLKKLNEFKANNIDVAKISLNISNNNEENKEMIEIIDGFLSVLNKLQDNEIKSIKTAEFKEWADKIIKDGNIKSKKMESLSSYVKELPDEINRQNSNTNIQELYKLIKS